MKRDMDDLDLRKAFAPMPADCRQALLDAANSVKEEKQVKRASFRAVLIAAIIIVATMGIAFAAQQLGWVDFYSGNYGITVSKEAEDAMNLAKPLSYEVGPMTFTFNQLLTDGHIAISSAAVRMTDGTDVLYAGDSDIYDAVDATGSDVIVRRYGLKPQTTWVEAAQQTGLPLYGIRALIEVDEPYAGGEAMEDPLWNEDGTIVYFNMPLLNSKAVQDELPLTQYMAVRRYDPATGEELDKWVLREQITLPVAAALAEKTYLPEGGVTLVCPEHQQWGPSDTDGEPWVEYTVPPIEMQLVNVRAEQFVTGIYLYATLKFPEGLDENTIFEVVNTLTLCDSTGEELPWGMNLCGMGVVQYQPEVITESMSSMETLPDSLIVTDGTTQITVK